MPDCVSLDFPGALGVVRWRFVSGLGLVAETRVGLVCKLRNHQWKKPLSQKPSRLKLYPINIQRSNPIPNFPSPVLGALPARQRLCLRRRPRK